VQKSCPDAPQHFLNFLFINGHWAFLEILGNTLTTGEKNVALA
jgi:hypothetical protein